MKRKYRSISRRQLGDGLIQCDPVNNGHRIRIFRAFYDLNWSFAIFSRGLHADSPFSEVHENLIDREPMEPGSKSGLAPKTPNLSKELDENLLSKIFSFRNTPRHSKA